MKIKFIIFLIVCATTTSAVGQSEYWFAFKITSLEKKASNQFQVAIAQGAEVGLKVNQPGEFWATVNPNREDVESRFVSKITFKEVLTGKSVAMVQSDEAVYEGDIIFAKIPVPEIKHTSYFFLASYGIELTNETGNPYYGLDEILKLDGPRLRTEKFVSMQQALNEAGQKMKAAGDKEVVKEGKHKGKLLHTILTETDTLQVWSYLYHLTQDYERNLGKTIPLIKDYTDYVQEGDRITVPELKSLFELEDSASWEKRYVYYKRKIDKIFLDGWIKEAKELRESEKYEEAKEIILPSLFLAGKNNSANDVGRYAYEMALVTDAQNEYNQSARWYKMAGDKFAESENGYAQGYANHYLARAYSYLSKNDQAIESYKKAMAIRAKLVQDETDKADYSNDLYTSTEALATLYRETGNHQQAIKFYGLALELAKVNGKQAQQGDVLWNTGYVYVEGLKNYAEGVAYYDKAFLIYQSLNDSASMIDLKRNIAINYDKINNYAKAKETIAEGIVLARSWGKPAKLAYVLDYQGVLTYDRKDFSKSIESYLESEKIYKALNENDKLIKTKKNLSNAYKDSKKYSLALAKTQERIDLINPTDISLKADAYWDFALLHGKDYLKNPPKAIELYKQAEKIYTELKDTLNQITIINNMAYQYRDLGDSLTAYKTHERALVLTVRPQFVAKRADTYERLAFTYNYFKSRKKEIAAFSEAMRLYHQANDLINEGKMAENIGDAYQAKFEYDKASEFFKKSIEVYRLAGNKKEEAESYWDLAYNVGQYQRKYDLAIAEYQTSYKLYMEAGDSVNASVVLSNIGQNYWSKLDFKKAIESHQAAIDLASKCKNHEQVASSWSKLASLYTEANNPVASTEAMKKAVASLQTLNDSTLLSTGYHDLAASYLRAREYAPSIDFFNRSLFIRKALKDSINWASSLHQLAGVYQSKNEYKQAIDYYNEALSLQKRIKDKSGIVYSLANLGALTQSVDNNYKQAEVYFKESVKLATELKDDNILAYCYLRMKGLYRSQGKSALADEHANKALDLYKKNKQWKEVASTWVDIAYDASYVYGDNAKALKLIDQAQTVADTLNDVFTKALVISSRGMVMREIGEFQKALALGDESLKLYKEVKSDWGLAGVYIDMGNIYKQLSEYSLALANQLKADSLYKITKSDYSRLAPLANIGEIYSSQGDYKKGLEYYQQSLAIMKKANDQNENLSIIQACIGESHFYLNNYPESDKWLSESLKTAQTIGAFRPLVDALSVMGRLKLEEKKYDEAFKFLNDGVRISKEKNMKISYVGNLNLLGQLEVVRKNYTKAKPLLEESIKTSREMGKTNTLWESLYWLGILYKENKQLPQSTQYLKESIEVIEKIRNKVSGGEEARKLFSSDKNILKVYEALVDVLLQQGETDLAMSYLQKNNEDNLKEKFKGLDVKFQDDNKNKALEEERNRKAKLDGIEKQIENEKSLPTEKQNIEKLKNLEGIKTVAEGDYLKFVNQQVNVRPELSKFFNNSVQPAQLKGKKKQIPKDMALLSYLPGENQLYIFVATSDTVLAKVVNVTRAQLTRNINAVLNVVRTSQGLFDKPTAKNEMAEREELVNEMNQSDPFLKPFEELYHYMIAPASAEIAGKKRLCIIPNGSISYVPFQLLGKTLANGKFSLMMNQYSSFYANSTDMLLRVSGEEIRDLKILAFGNPDKTLPSTEKEVVHIKTLFPNASIFLREEATEDKAKFAGEEFNVMHFATHGNLDYEDFGKSFLTMAGNPAKEEDGLLTLEELWGMDVMSHLNIVVLSACQTAVSKGSDDSSPVSPASGFLQNGVKSVVATLWKVDDEATSILMQDFYKNIKTMDAVDALRLAQINLGNTPKFSHPYYWAAAVLLGDWR